ncbi:hypothetical protein A3D11_02360 [Candidatus Peribacteria bacterium RIFCSPHIGHO2_02_FULL_49_16]|nr:MAG: hypothetical protein A2880_03820 [Candidatus Peribacteria bacterium RIFCSPHIGHO2_01_FULL_49_38]OGJ59967.1 MAG: hypothetical protein A3D11_02360 [Candidatus Peribacteria bacterium RIFCSPHIGHO2_02_FULL_49_16]
MKKSLDIIIYKEDMNTKTTYLLCPDHSCKLFFDAERFTPPCENHCPKEKELVKIIKCLCGKLIDLPGDHSAFRRAACSDPTCGIRNLRQRCSGIYHLLYDRPK